MLNWISKKKKVKISGDHPVGPEIRTTHDLSDVQFVEEVYRQLLGREADEMGKAHQLKYLKECRSRLSLIMGIVKSEEFINKVIRENMPLPSIKEERPDRYRLTQDIHGQPAWVFQARDAADFDWLERRIVQNGYYEKPGVWSFIISEDKRLLAEMAAQINKRREIQSPSELPKIPRPLEGRRPRPSRSRRRPEEACRPEGDVITLSLWI